MRGCFRLIVVILILMLLGGVAALAFIIFGPGIPFLDNLGLGGGGATNVIPTEVSQFQDVEPPTVLPPEVVNTDNCEAAASSFAAQSAGGEERAQAQQQLPNGRAFPGKGANTKKPPGKPARNIVMIQFTDTSTQQQRNAYIQQIGGQSRRQIDKLNVYAVTLRRGDSPETLPADPIVVTAELDYEASALQNNEPDDPRYGEQWALPVMGVPSVWGSISTGSGTQVIAVIDSGVCLSHPDLAGRLTAGFDFVESDSTPQDELGHGCGVAGVIAAGMNNGIGIAGVAPNVTIMPLRVLDATGNGNYSAISEAIVYAADNGANIINLSLAGSFYSQVMADAVAYARARNVTVVAAAGNFGSSALYYPAAFSGVLAVGSVDPDLQRSSFSNYGDYVSVYAPGRDVLTTTLDGDYDFQTGTSFAAPLVAGMTAINNSLGIPLNVENDLVVAYPPEVVQQCN